MTLLEAANKARETGAKIRHVEWPTGLWHPINDEKGCLITNNRSITDDGWLVARVEDGTTNHTDNSLSSGESQPWLLLGITEKEYRNWKEWLKRLSA